MLMLGLPEAQWAAEDLQCNVAPPTSPPEYVTAASFEEITLIRSPASCKKLTYCEDDFLIVECC
jgi:hypothetical protein